MRARELWSKLPKVTLIPENLKLFWTFVAERQAIWHRRFVEKKPPPWTTDPILRDYKFTNVYRELDAGTIWYVKNVIPLVKYSSSYERKKALLWLTTMYRLVNRVETFEDVGLLLHHNWVHDRLKWKYKLERRQEQGKCIFTNAHLTLPSHEVGSTKLDKYIEVLDDFYNRLQPISDVVFSAPDLEAVFYSLMSIKCVGRFIAYEICCDLILAKAIPYTEDDWVNPGPGCKKGLNLIYPKIRTTQEYQDHISDLMLQQKTYFKQFGLKFYEYKHPLTLRGIEHSLCELQKYYKMIHKVGKQRMYFKPRDWPNAQGQIRFPREK